MRRDEPSLLYRREGNIAFIVFNRAESANAIDVSIAASFLDACRTIAADDRIRAVVLAGVGRSFVAGGDLAFMAEQPEAVAERLIDPMHTGLLMLVEHPALLISSVHGAAAGAGLSLVLASDLAIASRRARFNMAYARVGVSSDLGASWTLPRTVGPKKAMELAILNPVIDADEALRLGLVNDVVEEELLEERTRAIAMKVAEVAPAASGRMKRLLRTSYCRTFEEQLHCERTAFDECARQEGFSQRLRSFLR